MSEELKCPECPKVCRSKAGLTLHMNAMHLVLSPSQMDQAATSQEKRTLLKEETK